MLNMNGANYNFSGNSINNETVIADFYASKSDKYMSFSFNIGNIDNFDFTTIEEDFEEFRARVYQACGLLPEDTTPEEE